METTRAFVEELLKFLIQIQPQRWSEAVYQITASDVRKRIEVKIFTNASIEARDLGLEQDLAKLSSCYGLKPVDKHWYHHDQSADVRPGTPLRLKPLCLHGTVESKDLPKERALILASIKLSFDGLEKPVLRNIDLMDIVLSNMCLKAHRADRDHMLQANFRGARPLEDLIRNLSGIDVASSVFDQEQIEAIVVVALEDTGPLRWAAMDIIENPSCPLDAVLRFEQVVLNKTEPDRFTGDWLCSAYNLPPGAAERFAGHIAFEDVDATIELDTVNPEIRRLLQKRLIAEAMEDGWQGLEPESIPVFRHAEGTQAHELIPPKSECIGHWMIGWGQIHEFPLHALAEVMAWWGHDISQVRLKLYFTPRDGFLQALLLMDSGDRAGEVVVSIQDPRPLFESRLPNLIAQRVLDLQARATASLKRAKKRLARAMVLQAGAPGPKTK